MTIYEKLGAIQQALQAPKTRTNNFGGYKYRNCDDILSAVKPLLDEHKCVLLLKDGIETAEGRVYIKATAQFFDTSSAEPNKCIEVTAFAREEETKKGMDACQVTGTCSSYARKYALNGLFCIDDAIDSDYLNDRPKDTEKVKGERIPDETRTEKNDFPFCQECGKRITEDERSYSVRYFKQALCRDCQKKRRA